VLLYRVELGVTVRQHPWVLRRSKNLLAPGAFHQHQPSRRCVPYHLQNEGEVLEEASELTRSVDLSNLTPYYSMDRRPSRVSCRGIDAVVDQISLNANVWLGKSIVVHLRKPLLNRTWKGFSESLRTLGERLLIRGFRVDSPVITPSIVELRVMHQKQDPRSPPDTALVTAQPNSAAQTFQGGSTGSNPVGPQAKETACSARGRGSDQGTEVSAGCGTTSAPRSSQRSPTLSPFTPPTRGSRGVHLGRPSGS
jgi:hypothetical protein